jgi:hypothetical protein
MPPSTAHHHTEWPMFLDISGPFLSLPVLLSAFPQGLDDFPSEEARSLRADYEYWKENANDPATHTAWVRLVLESMLGYSGPVLLAGQAIPGGLKAEFPEHEETLRPDLLLAEPGTHKPRLLIQVYPPGQSLEKGLQGSRWQASLATRMMELLHATEIRLGLVTNGEQWLLVDAPRGDTSGFTTWYAALWFDEPITLRALRSLLGARRFFGVPDAETLESLLARSAQDQQEITDQLGLQVRHAVEILIQSLDRADQDQGRRLLGADVPPSLLYEAALTVMMRLVFMLTAEERKLLPIDDDRYAAYYAVSTLREQLQTRADQDGEEVLERRYDAWSRLLAVFRAVYAGIHHQDLHSPAYGGGLFDPERYPFLEGRPQKQKNLTPAPSLNGKGKEGNPAPLPVNNRTVLHLLDALQMLQVSVPGGGAVEKRRLSFRALDVEQIGHVYEGLLDHMATRASEPVLGLKGAKRQEPEVALSALEKAASKGEGALLEWLHEQTGRSVSALKNALTGDLFKNSDGPGRLHSVCGDEVTYQRVLPFSGLLRVDDLSFPVVILAGSVYVTLGTTRRATGTHYTPRSLTEPVVQHTLEPLVYYGPAEGLPRAQWRLRSPWELLALKICDMAMGSGGFLVQVVRYLAERLVEAWALYGTGAGPAGEVEFSVFGQAAAALMPEDQLIYARRLVAERCIYGVDKNPLAVEIAKLSLWLITLSKDLPFTFLNHALKCGDSLVGASADEFLRWANRKKSAAMSLDQEVLREELEKSRRLRKQLESFVVRDVQDAARKEALLQEAEAAMEHIKRGADLLTGVKLLGLKPQETENLQLRLVDPYIAGELDGKIDSRKYMDAVQALAASHKESAFHWEFAFPEVFEKGGFNAFVGNPPFIGGKKISGVLSVNYLKYLKDAFNSTGATTDLCAYFFRQAGLLLKRSCSTFGLVATNTISQGDTRSEGLDILLKNGFEVFNAIKSQPWPGDASLEVSIVHIYNSMWNGEKILDSKVTTSSINSLLEENETEENKPDKLLINNNKAYMGTIILGEGFVLQSEERLKLLRINHHYSEVIVPYMNGDDLASRFDTSPSRWVINFGDMSLNEVTNKFPNLLELVRERVKPQRDKVKRDAYRERWWQFAEKCSAWFRNSGN